MIDWPAWLIAMATTTSEPEQENEKADWKVIMKHPSNSEGQSRGTMWDHARMCPYEHVPTLWAEQWAICKILQESTAADKGRAPTRTHTHAKEVYAFILSWMEVKRTVNHVQWRSVKGIGICITISMWWWKWSEQVWLMGSQRRLTGESGQYG